MLSKLKRISFAKEEDFVIKRQNNVSDGPFLRYTFSMKTYAYLWVHTCRNAFDEAGQADDVKVFNIPRKQAASTSGTKFELAETYSYEEFASRVVPRRALRHLTASRSPRLSSALSHRRP